MRHALCVILLGLGWAAPSTALGDPDRTPTIHSVAIRGNDSVSDSDILSRLATHPPEGLITVRRYDFDPLALSTDRERIERLYRERGFFGARVVDVHAIDLGANRMGVRFDVVEGEPTRIARMRILGLPDDFEPTERLDLALSRLREGDIVNHDAYVDAREQLRRALHQRGHAHASVTGALRVDPERGRAFITLRADPGPRVRYGEVTISGLTELPESAVRNRVAWRPGDVYSPSKMETTQGRLYELGYFGSVRLLYPSEGQPEVIDVEVRATEGARREIQLGGGVGADTTFFEARGRASFLVRGFFDPLLSVRATARPAYQIQRADLGAGAIGGEAAVTFNRIDFLHPRATGTAQLAVRSTELEAYEARGGIARLSWTIPLFSDRLELRAGWQIRPLFEIVDLHPAIEEAPEVAEDIGATVSPYRLGAFEQNLVVDLRDSILSPTRGGFFSLRFEQGGPLAGGAGDLTYTNLTGEVRAYLPVGERLIVAARGRLGSTLTGTLPITQRYLSGGATSHRGFGNRKLSPTLIAADPDEVDGDPVARIGGGALFESSFELRNRVTRIGNEWLTVALFADGGDVVGQLDDLELDNLHWALGAGLRYNTIVGPIRFDVGYRITALPRPGGPVDSSRLVFHFSLGEAF